MDTGHTEAQPGTPPPRRWDLLTIAVAAPVMLALRIAYATQDPVNTGDIVRHLLYGAGFWQAGPSFAAQPLNVLAGLQWVPWSGNPYNYPPVALLFFATLAAIHSSVFFAKIALTVVEGANALLVWRVTDDKWCGLIYWCAPLTLWWVSGEAQFEGVQTFFALLGLWALKRRPWLAWALFAIAIQTKLTAIFLFPVFLLPLFRADRTERLALAARCAGGFLLGCLPTIAALFFYPAVSQVAGYSAPMRLNPFHWNFMDTTLTGNWLEMKVWEQTASWLLLLITVAAALRAPRRFAEWVPALLFICLLKSWHHVHFWYWIALAPMLACIPDRELRRALFCVWAVCEVSAVGQIVLGPFGYTVRETFYDFGLYTPVAEFLTQSPPPP